MNLRRCAIIACATLVLAGLWRCADTGAAQGPVAVTTTAPAPGGLSRAEVRRRVQAMTELGRTLFFDKALSGSGQLACASCHSPDHGFGPGNDLPVQLGGHDMRQPGVRAVPSLTYLQAAPQFSEHYFDSEDDADESVDNGPTGGLTWDGRADRGGQQARVPLLSAFEMANASPDEVVAHALQAGYGERLRAILGEPAVLDRAAVFAAILEAFETYEQDYRVFYPYSSKYDASLAGKATLTEQEARGLKVFEAPEKGNCAECHISQRGNDGTPPQFTDYGLIALGLPRNQAIPANADKTYFDLGLCGPLRTDLTDHKDYCGLFRTPSLRNVALRKSFFHNGIFHSLRQAVAFYARRDSNPDDFYPRSPDGTVQKFDDLPEPYRANLNTDPPFDRKPGAGPVLTDAEIDDVVAFLGTLTDGYVGK